MMMNDTGSAPQDAQPQEHRLLPVPRNYWYLPANRRPQEAAASISHSELLPRDQHSTYSSFLLPWSQDTAGGFIRCNTPNVIPSVLTFRSRKADTKRDAPEH